MKLMIAIVNKDDYDKIARQLMDEEYRVTIIASTGGFFRKGSTTLLIGTEEEKVGRAAEIIKSNSSIPEGAGGQKAAIFVLNIKEYIRL
jgi:uncharacterized protein YaaQ